MTTHLVIEDLDDETKRGFLDGCVRSGMRETHCERCGCYLLTRGDEDALAKPGRFAISEICALDASAMKENTSRQVTKECPVNATENHIAQFVQWWSRGKAPIR